MRRLARSVLVALVVATTAIGSSQVAAAAPGTAYFHQADLSTPLSDLVGATGPSEPWGPDAVGDLDGGTVLRPSRDVAKVKRDQVASQKSRARFQTIPALSGYQTTRGFGVFSLPVGYRPYDNLPIAKLPTVAALAAGTNVKTVDGAASFNHPVRQAQASFILSNSYRLTRNPVYLTAARASAQRLIDNKVILDGAWYYPYDFDFAVHGDTTQTLRAPWYSGMAEGYALTAFVRLFELTGEAKWKEAADATFAALHRGTVPGEAFVSWVDSGHNLWLEEYPRPEVTNSEKVLNGHVFATYGLYDYWQLTQSQEALTMINGALTTVEQLAPTQFRRVNGASVYSLHHRQPTVTYHHVHVDQQVYLYQMTHRAISVSTANLFRTDFPLRTVSGSVVLTPRSRFAYRLDANRKVIATRAVSFIRDTGAPANRRERSLGGPVMLRISSGPYLDWWFPESYGATWLLGAKEPHLYQPRPLTVTFAAGAHTAFRYDSAGRRAGTKVLIFSHPLVGTTARSAIVEGRTSIYLSVGAFAGYWVPLSSKIRFS